MHLVHALESSELKRMGFHCQPVAHESFPTACVISTIENHFYARKDRFFCEPSSNYRVLFLGVIVDIQEVPSRGAGTSPKGVHFGPEVTLWDLQRLMGGSTKLLVRHANSSCTPLQKVFRNGRAPGIDSSQGFDYSNSSILLTRGMFIIEVSY